tara:strand:- start:494 stop:1051 length:558 start_codon:yes stop_codon:yes gene_type:complete
MAVEYWKARQEIHDTILALIGQYHPDLALVSDEIVAVFREKAGKTGGQVVLGSSKKVAPLANALAGESFKFVLELAADQWEHELTSKQKEALLDHLLTACRCEEDPKSGDLKCTVAKPDIMAFRENVERYGMWFPTEEGESSPSPVDEMFGEEEPTSAEAPSPVDEILDDLLEPEHEAVDHLGEE